jgi:basic membrane protein A
VKEGAIDIVSMAEDVPAETKAKVEEVKKGLKAMAVCDLERPDCGQHRQGAIAKDAVADDKFLGGLNFYVKGVEGKIPGGK